MTSTRRQWDKALKSTAPFLALFVACVVAQATQMTGPPVPAAWRDKGGPGTVAAVLNLTAPRLGELTDAQAGALRKALLATLASDVPGLDVKRVKQQGTAAPVVEQGGVGAADRMRVGVDLVAPQARLSDLLRRMQAVSDNAELAGSLRASGLYDLTDARFDSYELRAGGRSAAGGGEKDGDTDKGGAQQEGGGAVIELPPLPPLPKPIAVPPTAPAQPAAPPQLQPSPAPPPSPSGKGQAPITAGIEVAGTSPSSSDLTPERRAALARAVAVLAGVPEGQVSVVEEAGRRRALLQQGAAAAAAPWARRFEVQVTPADAGQAAAARAALTRLATPAGAADLRAALASQGWDGLAAAGLTGLNGKKVNGAGTGAAPVLKPAAAANEAGGGGESKSGGGKLAGKLAGIIIGCLVGATLLALAAAYALAYFLGWCRCLGVGVKGAGGGDEEKAGGGVGWRAKAKARAAGGGAPSAAVASSYKLTEGEEERAADLKAAAAAAAAGNKADADGAAVAAAAAAVADDARRDLASIAAAGVTSLRRLASGAKDRTGRPGSAGVGVGGAAGAATSTRAGATTTPVSGDAAAMADAVMDFVRKGAPLAGTFALERGALVPGQAAVTVKARQVGGAARAAVATFYVDDDAHARAVGLGGRLPDGSATPAVLAAYGRGDAPGAPGLPPVIVREAPDYALDAWVAKRFRTPDPMQRKAVLSLVTKPVAAFAAKGLVHGALSPATVHWFADDNAMKLAGADGWAPKGAHVVAHHPVPAFAAPEVLSALSRAEETGGPAPTIAATPAQDAWSLGMLAYLVLTDAPLIPVDASACDVAAAIGTGGPLPWERAGGALEALEDPVAGAAIRGLLQREPKKRTTAAALLGGPLFKGLAAAAAAAGTTGTPRRVQ